MSVTVGISQSTLFKSEYRTCKVRLGKVLAILIVASLPIHIGCSVNSHKADSYRDLIDKERVKIGALKFKANSIEQKIQPNIRLLEYTKSIEGREFFKAGRCRTPPAKYFPVTARPSNACENESDARRHVGQQCRISDRCDLVGAMVALGKLPKKLGYLTNLGCSASDEDKDILEGSVDVVVDTFCDIGASTGRMPRSKPAKSVLGLAYWAARGAACYAKLGRLRQEVDSLSQCMEKEATSCRATYANWVNGDGVREERIAKEQSRVEIGVAQCETSTTFLREGGSRTLEDVDSELVARRAAIKTIRSDIERANKRIVDWENKQASALASEKKIKTEQEKKENELRDF